MVVSVLIGSSILSSICITTTGTIHHTGIGTSFDLGAIEIDRSCHTGSGLVVRDALSERGARCGSEGSITGKTRIASINTLGTSTRGEIELIGPAHTTFTSISSFSYIYVYLDIGLCESILVGIVDTVCEGWIRETSRLLHTTE
jgi:hypothetical protein